MREHRRVEDANFDELKESRSGARELFVVREPCVRLSGEQRVQASSPCRRRLAHRMRRFFPFFRLRDSPSRHRAVKVRVHTRERRATLHGWEEQRRPLREYRSATATARRVSVLLVVGFLLLWRFCERFQRAAREAQRRGRRDDGDVKR